MRQSSVLHSEKSNHLSSAVSLNPDSLSSAIELGSDAEIKDFLKSVDHKDLTVFEHPLRVRYDDWLFCIGSSVCISSQDKEDDDWCYVCVMLAEDSDKRDEFYRIKKASSAEFEIISGSGLGWETDYVECGS